MDHTTSELPHLQTDAGTDVERIASSLRRCREAFFSLGESRRQEIVLLLAHRTGLNVRSIAENLPGNPSRPAVSHHLKQLLKAKLVEVRKRGTENLYTLALDPTLCAIKQLISDVEQGCAAPIPAGSLRVVRPAAERSSRLS